MKKNLNISNEELMKIDYKNTHILKKFTTIKAIFCQTNVKNHFVN